MINDELRAQFERIGEEQVRLNLNNHRYNERATAIAIEWLAPREEESRRRISALQAEQVEIARSAKDAAWVSAQAAKGANLRSTVAIIVALIALGVSVFGLHQG